MRNTLTATLCQTCMGEPLAVVDGLPGGSAELTPGQLRALAAGLLQIAVDAEAQPTASRAYLRKRREYSLSAIDSKQRSAP